MTTMEHAPQRQKSFDGRKQDHGDAATQTLDRGKDPWDYYHGSRLKEKVHLDLAEQDALDAYHPSSAELEAAADKLLQESNNILADNDAYEAHLAAFGAATEPGVVPGAEDEPTEDDYYTEDDEVDTHYYPTEVDLGIPTRQEIRRRMARRVTLDVFDDDDDGDDGFAVPVHINRK